MVWPWIMPYSPVHFGVRIAGAFCTELPYCPMLSMLVVEKFDESVSRIPVGALRVSGRWARGYDDCSAQT